jgi:hypothetical protein
VTDHARGSFFRALVGTRSHTWVLGHCRPRQLLSELRRTCEHQTHRCKHDCAGIPVWWATTSLERPTFPAAAHIELAQLPITVRIHVVTGQSEDQTLTDQLLQDLKVDAEQAILSAQTADGEPETVAQVRHTR